MKILRLVINCAEDFRIVEEDGNIYYRVNTEFLGDDPDWSYAAEVDRETFKKCFEKVSWIPDGWCESLKYDYQAILDFLKETEVD